MKMFRCLTMFIVLLAYIFLVPLVAFELPYREALAEWTPYAFGCAIVALLMFIWIGKEIEDARANKES